MCQSCVGCGKCNGKPRPPLPAGACPVCGEINGRDASLCEHCGRLLPQLADAQAIDADAGRPGASRKRGARLGASR